MVYKLSDQLDHVGNSKYIFEAYNEYLRENRNKFPTSALGLIASEQWYGGSGSTAPYYCELQNVEIIDFGKETAHLILTLIKKDHRDYKEKPFRLRLIYQGVLELEIPYQKDISINPFIWRYDEFLFFDPWSSYGHNEKMFTHNIEWVGKHVWSITAKDIIAIWEELWELIQVGLLKNKYSFEKSLGVDKIKASIHKQSESPDPFRTQKENILGFDGNVALAIWD